MDILRSHTDRSGYDILLEAEGVERHVQLKSSFVGAKTATQKINVRLAEKPSGCVVWVRFQRETFELAEFLWFGGLPGEPLPPWATVLPSTPRVTSLAIRQKGLGSAS